MKRAVLVLFGIVILAGIGTAWWFLRDTPEKLLRDGLRHLVEAKSAETVRIDSSWTDPVKRTTVGWTAFGQVDAKDLTAPGFFGVLDVGEGVFSGEETADIVLLGHAVAIRPRTVTDEFTRRYEMAIGDPTHATFAQLDRDQLLRAFSLASLIASGKTADIRNNLPAIVSVVRIFSPWVHQATDPAAVMTVPFSVDANALRPFLISLVRVWNGRAPNAAEIQWVDRITAELSAGTFKMAVDTTTRRPVSLDADWSHSHLHLELYGLNAKTDIALPSPLKEATESLLGVKSSIGLPVSETRTGVVVPTGTVMVPSQKAQTDLQRFGQYLDELAKRRKGKYQ